MQLRIAGTVNDSVVDGDGYRFAIFTQGCPHHCPGCQNPATWDPAGGREIEVMDLLPDILQNPLLAGVTFSGGEPFAQPAPLAELARAVHQRPLTVWCYTGYTLEALWEMRDPAVDDLLAEIDVLVDGPYVEAERDLTLRFRGSRNQRVIDLAATRGADHICLKYED